MNEQPCTGGCYVRQPDGSLKRAEVIEVPKAEPAKTELPKSRRPGAATKPEK